MGQPTSIEILRNGLFILQFLRKSHLLICYTTQKQIPPYEILHLTIIRNLLSMDYFPYSPLVVSLSLKLLLEK